MTAHYDIDGLVRVSSAVPLRELSYFRVPSVESPDIVVRRGMVGWMPRLRVRTYRNGTGLVRREHLGAFGADFTIKFGAPIMVTANPLLVASPHVLYTNVIEALLRFVFVSKGRVLLHCASIVHDGEALLLSAQTDTGKTTTVLRLIDRLGVHFLADDMTIIDPTGVAHRYPKPMTMSFHTFKSFAWTLSRAGRVKLSIQSRVHSKSGRRVGHGLSRLPIPIMAINAITQAVVPPPKYHVTDLLPTTIAPSAPLRRVIFLERGEAMEAAVEVDAALEMLMANTEDAYTFPPYREIAPFIEVGGLSHDDLMARERELLRSALANVDIRVVRLPDRSWADRISTLLPDAPTR